MWRRIRQTVKGSRRRAVVAVQVAVVLTMLVGFAALAVDVSAMYTVKAESQRTADAAALAAASRLSAYEEALDQGVTVETLARSAATEYTVGNAVLGQQLNLDENDVTFGHAVHNPVTGGYDFQPNQTPHDAVRVAVRQTEDSSNGAFALFFAPIFGVCSADVSAEAIAMLVPRDIAVVADLSGSHNDDSELCHYKSADINLHGVWDGFPGGIDDGAGSLWDGDEFPLDGDGYSAQMAGPAWGLFKELGYGTETIDADFDPTADSGLIELPKDEDWSNAVLESFLAAQGYIPDEIDAIMSDAHDSDGAWDERVAAALGFARWDSGMPGGLWEQLGIDPDDAGNDNDWVGGSELTWLEVFGDRSISTSKSIWRDYINGYMNKNWTSMYYANHDFRYRFGVKTFINYLTERRPSNSQTPEFANTHQQPMQAVKEAVVHLVTTIEGLESEDQLSLEIYGTRGRHEVDLTENYYEVSNRLNAMQAGHYDAWTNMGAGILRAQQELLTGTNVNPIARKVMFLLTDGYANVPCEYCSGGDYSGGKNYARAMAQQAADQGIQIFCVSVGSYCDESLMDEIATIGSGEHFNASGAGIAQMAVRLNAIFERLGGRRPVELIK